MSSSLNLSPAEYRAEEHAVHVLFVGQKLTKTHKYFKRTDEVVRCDHAMDIKTAVDMMLSQAAVRAFDCVIVDMRRAQDGAPVDVAAVGALGATNKLVVMATPSKAATFRDIEGVHDVLINPVGRMDVIECVVSSAQPRDPQSDELLNMPAGFSTSSSLRSQGAAQPLPDAPAADPVVPTGQAKGIEETEEKDVFDRAAAELEELAGKQAFEAVPPQAAKPELEEPAPEAAPVIREVANDPAPAPEPDPAPVVEAEAELPVETAPHEAPHSGEQHGEGAVKKAVTKGFESSISKIQDVDQSIWQRFVPLANFVYKKLAIIVLTALFATFVTYGAMIVFFMTSSSWSLPFELSKGHKLVEKVERDLSSMRLRLNQVRQDISVAQAEIVTADRDLQDGQLNLVLTKRTVEEEISLQEGQQLEIRQHIARLKQVIQDFNALNGKGGFAKNLENAYSKRLITRKSLNSGTLAVLETLHRMATVQNEISVKQLELRRVDRRLEFLLSLLEEIDQPQLRVITSAGSELAHLAREVIESKNRIASAKELKDTANSRLGRLNNSLEVISSNIASLEATPAARAMNEPVMVLFVPYTNSDNVLEGVPLFRCTFSIVLCSKVGEVGVPVDGETTSVHPLFGKPMRGTFVEAKFDHPSSATAELVHAGGKPLFF